MVLLIFQCFDGKKCAKRENTALSKTRYHMTKLLTTAASSLELVTSIIPTLSIKVSGQSDYMLEISEVLKKTRKTRVPYFL